MIPHNKPTIGKEEIQAVEKALKSGWLVQGREVREFEDGFSKYLGFKSGGAAAFSSGTASLYAVLLALEVGSGDEVIIPSYLCSAVLNAVYLTGARPVLVDVNPDDFNISFKETKKKINSHSRAIIVPHIFGMPADVDEFLKLGVPVIEDCAQGVGAKFKGKHLGTFGKAAMFSFYASKPLTTGYGGMLVSGDKNFIKKIKDFREFDCRKTYKKRFNFQLSDFQGAMGKVQLKKLPSFLKKRKKIAKEYYKVLSQDRVWPSLKDKNKEPNFYRFLVQTTEPKKIQKFLERKGIKTIVPIQTHELLHRYLGQNPRRFPVSEKIAKTTLSLPIYPSLTGSEIKKITTCLKEYFTKEK